MTNVNRKTKRKEKREKITLTLIFIIGILLIVNITGNSNSYGDGELEVIEIKVISGDSLWSIAKEYTPDNIDIRETIYIVKKINGLETSVIYPGQSLKIPKMY